MTDKEFVTWFKGFVEACHEYAPTPKQWDTIKDKLKEVNSGGPGFPIGTGTFTWNNTQYAHVTTTNDKHLLND